MDHRSDLLKLVQSPPARAVTSLLDRFPGLGRFEILRPKRKCPTLAGTDRVNRAAVLPEDAVSTGADAKTGRAVEILHHVASPKGVEWNLEPTGDAFRLGLAGVNAAPVYSPAAVVTLLAGESKPAMVKR